MRNTYFFILCSFFVLTIHAQDYSTLWEGHFSYLNIKDIVQGNDRVFAASENAVFIYDFQTNELETITSVDGLSGELISTIHFSEAYGLLVIGYDNGLIEIFNETDQSVISVVDILQKVTIPPNSKSINHFNENNNVIYIATDYGISVYNLERLEFGDTYFIGSAGSQIIVNETAISGDYIYAACGDSNGIKKGLLESGNLINYQEWNQLVDGTYNYITELQGKVFTVRNNNIIYEVLETSKHS